jgi:hypothetical protein
MIFHANLQLTTIFPMHRHALDLSRHAAAAAAFPRRNYSVQQSHFHPRAL